MQGLKSLSELCVPMYVTETGCADKEGERRVSTTKAYFDEVGVWLRDQAACCLGCTTRAWNHTGQLRLLRYWAALHAAPEMGQCCDELGAWTEPWAAVCGGMACAVVIAW